MKVVGYGICGPGEAKRYMRETMEDFKRLCDVVVILGNNAGAEEKSMVLEYGFKYVEDDREWGKLQWKIKYDFLKNEVSRFADDGDIVVCLDMDEVLDKRLTRQWLIESPFDAYHVFIVDLWNDSKHYKPKSCFWNVRIFRWNGIVDITKKPLHCGLAPEWARAYNRYAPFLLYHKGLMDPKDRARKIARYEKYDPNQIHLGHAYYSMLHEDSAEPFDEPELHATIADEVASYKQSRPRGPSIYMSKKTERYAYFRNSAGVTVDVPERHVALTKKQPGMTFVGWADDAEKEIEELFADEKPAEYTPQGPTSITKKHVDELIDSMVPEESTPGITQKNRVGIERQARPARGQAKKK